MPLRPTHNGRFSKSVGDIPNNSLSIAGRWHAAMDERLYRTWLQPMFTSFENCGMRWELLKGAALLMMSHPEQAIEPLLRDGGSMLKLARRKYVSTDANTRVVCVTFRGNTIDREHREIQYYISILVESHNLAHYCCPDR